MRTIFTSEQIAQLSKNPCVWRITERSIHYTYEFKKRALDLYAQGIKSNDIWRQAGFEVSIWKKNYCQYTLKDWRRLVKKGGLESLTKPSGVQADSGYRRARTPESDRVRRLQLHVEYLEAENAFLARLRAKRAESNSGHPKNINSSGD
jgi:transposase-like protein